MVFQYLESTLHTLGFATSDKPRTRLQVAKPLLKWYAFKHQRTGLLNMVLSFHGVDDNDHYVNDE